MEISFFEKMKREPSSLERDRKRKSHPGRHPEVAEPHERDEMGGESRKSPPHSRPQTAPRPTIGTQRGHVSQAIHFDTYQPLRNRNLTVPRVVVSTTDETGSRSTMKTSWTRWGKTTGAHRKTGSGDSVPLLNRYARFSLRI
jgi:hypothetical protein